MKLIRKIAIGITISILFVQTLGINLLYDFYIFDKTDFITFFCENKDKPKLHCNGACMLSKLNKHEKNNVESTSFQNIPQFQLYFFIQHYKLNLTAVYSKKLSIIYSYCTNLYNSEFLKDILRPPILV